MEGGWSRAADRAHSMGSVCRSLSFSVILLFISQGERRCGGRPPLHHFHLFQGPLSEVVRRSRLLSSAGVHIQTYYCLSATLLNLMGRRGFKPAPSTCSEQLLLSRLVQVSQASQWDTPTF